MDKILFFDIDGTLGQHGVITESNLKALHLLKEKGYKTLFVREELHFMPNVYLVILLVELLVVMDVIFFMKERSFIVGLLPRNN